MDNNEYGFKKDTLFLVTGGAGFIGSNICERIVEMGYHVRCLDNFSTGSINNIEPLLKSRTFELVKGDINDINVCVNACEGVDYVLHQAAFGSVPRSIESPVLFCKNNISGSVNMLEAARQSKVKKFVYASSSSVYGDSALLPQKEGQEGRVLSPYALTKRCVEEWAQQYYYHYGVPTIGLRYFNVFGRKQNPNGAYAAVIPRFITCLLKGERPTIYGDGKQSRDFTCVENVIQANLKACLTDDRANGQVFNISNGEEVPLFEVYQKIATILNTDLVPEYCSARKGDIRHSCADIEKAKTLLSYEPKTTFDQGIKAAIDWYRRLLKKAVERITFEIIDKQSKHYTFISQNGDIEMKTMIELFGVEEPKIGDLIEIPRDIIYEDEVFNRNRKFPNKLVVSGNMLSFEKPNDEVTVPQGFNIENDYIFITYKESKKRILVQRAYG